MTTMQTEFASPPFVRPATLPELLTVEQVARWLDVSVRTIWRWTAEGILPAPVRPRNRSTRWRAEDLERFLAEVSEEVSRCR